jgi:formiminotetrahydrofolate cyclodeaminase
MADDEPGPVAASYLSLALGEFLDQLASRQAAPGGGAAAAITISVAAGLVGMAARYSVDRLPGAEAMAQDAERLRARAAALATADAEAYQQVLSARANRAGRDQVAAALTRAAEIPLELAELGAATARLASRLAAEGKPDIRGDATTGLLLAEAATRASAHLVVVNVEAGGGSGELLERAADHVARAREAAAWLA